MVGGIATTVFFMFGFYFITNGRYTSVRCVVFGGAVGIIFAFSFVTTVLTLFCCIESFVKVYCLAANKMLFQFLSTSP